MARRNPIRRLLTSILETRFIFFALLVHILALIVFGGRKVFQAVEQSGYIETSGEIFSRSSTPPPPENHTTPSVQTATEARNRAALNVPVPDIAKAPIAVNRPDLPFSLPVPDTSPTTPAPLGRASSGMGEAMAKADLTRMSEVKKTVAQWELSGAYGANAGRTVKAKFVCYIGKYSDGDWNCNSGEIFQGKFVGNCMANLMLQVSRWTQGRILADLKPQPISLSSDDLLRLRPPFVFLTGHKDFTFTTEEVQQLREYLLVGGCIWADNSLPGRRSRFDLAFRREMKRVLPDRDFETVSPTHPIFNSFYKLTEVPPGMNYYHEPVEMVRIGDEIAVIYTLNAYSDLWQTAFNEKNQPDTTILRDPETGDVRDLLGPHWAKDDYDERKLYFRNVNEESVRNSYRLGINILVHLLLRFQDKLAPG
ncbi:MAG: DUF4159 domain-containing protein [Verrucomicrobiae bacterium]|nr:DUF4159 domain-containing protein [Verrucomicrobiae bacterium]